MKLSVRDICILALFGALMYAIQVAMAVLPNIEGVSLLVILVAVFYGWRALYPVTLFVLLEGVTYGFGIWWYFYAYAWPLLVVLCMLVRRLCGARAWAWALVSGVYGLLFGALYAAMFLVIGSPQTALAAWLSGLVFDALHAGGNFVLCLVLFRPLYILLRRLTTPKTPHIMDG